MKKVYLLLLLIVFLTVLSACMDNKEEKSRLNIPINLQMNKNVLTFNEVEGASSYILNIDGENITLNDTTYTFTTAGNFNVRVQALGENVKSSLFSDLYIFRVRFLKYPDDLTIINNQLQFTKDPDADSYDIEVNGTVYNTKEDLPPYLLPGTYELRIRARSQIYNESEFSPLKEVVVNKEDRLITTNQYEYSILSKYELPLYSYKKLSLSFYEMDQEQRNKEGLVINTMPLVYPNDYYVSNNAIYFSLSYMDYLSEKLKASREYEHIYYFNIETNLGTHEIKLTIHRKDTPYSYQTNTQSTNFNDDVTFTFDLRGFEFKYIKDIKGEDLDIESYEFKENSLTLYAKYLTKFYEIEKRSSKLEFKIIFEKNTIKVEYPIYITK
ncbi:hypothetical protein [Acholeplasma granularum]|uniref:hypothetical protein n=1 Tax=Acholeplasma granularum TaxID=264635 RepID=UPI000472DD4C|nr:hypothetical protein [Acholeplasma granularum]